MGIVLKIRIRSIWTAVLTVSDCGASFGGVAAAPDRPLAEPRGTDPRTRPTDPDALRLMLVTEAGHVRYTNTIQVPIPYVDTRTGRITANLLGTDFTDFGDTPLRTEVKNGSQSKASLALAWQGLLAAVIYERTEGRGTPRFEDELALTNTRSNYAAWKRGASLAYRFNRRGFVQPYAHLTTGALRLHYEYTALLNYNAINRSYDFNHRILGEGAARENGASGGVSLFFRSIGLRIGPFYRYQRVRVRFTFDGLSNQPVATTGEPPVTLPDRDSLLGALQLQNGPTIYSSLSRSLSAETHTVGLAASWQPVRFLRFGVGGGTNRSTGGNDWSASILFFFHKNMGLRASYLDASNGVLGRSREFVAGPVFLLTY